MSVAIRKYEDCPVNFDFTGNGMAQSAEYQEFLNMVAQADAVADNIIIEFSKIDESINEFKENMYEAGDEFLSVSGDIFSQLGKKKCKDEDDLLENGIIAMGGLAVGAAGFITKGIGWIGGSIKKMNADRKKRKMLEELAEKKKEVAKAKYKPVKKFREQNVNELMDKLRKNYTKELHKTILAEDPLLDGKVLMFKRGFGLIVKIRFIANALDYALAEMEAWMEGYDDSSFTPVSVADILDEEILGWKKIYGIGTENWDEFVLSWLRKDTVEYPAPIAALFTDATLFSNYVGVNLHGAENCKTAIFKSYYGELNVGKYTSAAKLLERNPYIIDCKANIAENWKLPAHPKGFGFGDIVVMILTLAAVSSITLVTFIYMPGLLIRILSVALTLLFVIISAVAFFWKDNGLFDQRLPYVKREDKYNELVARKMKAIKDREKEFRIKHKQVSI